MRKDSVFNYGGWMGHCCLNIWTIVLCDDFLIKISSIISVKLITPAAYWSSNLTFALWYRKWFSRGLERRPQLIHAATVVRQSTVLKNQNHGGMVIMYCRGQGSTSKTSWCVSWATRDTDPGASLSSLVQHTWESPKCKASSRDWLFIKFKYSLAQIWEC